MNVDVAALVEVLRVEPTDDGRFRAENLEVGATVFGGQIMAQTIVAGSTVLNAADRAATHRAKTLHTAFARPARSDAPLELEVDTIQRGRTFSSATVTVLQSDRICARSMFLCSADEPDFVHHAVAAPEVAAPPVRNDTMLQNDTMLWQVAVVGDVDVDDPDAVGPPELDVWSRFPGAPDDPVVDQALLAFATDGFLIGTAMRPHRGVGQAQAHVSVATGVVSHTLTFHRPAPAAEWLLLSHRSPFAGGGRCYGTADVFDRAGTLVASFAQDGLLRPI